MNTTKLRSATPRTTAPELPKRIVRRDGADVPFESARIASALARAGAASGEYDDEEAQLLTARVLKVLHCSFGMRVVRQLLQEERLELDPAVVTEMWLGRGANAEDLPASRRRERLLHSGNQPVDQDDFRLRVTRSVAAFPNSTAIAAASPAPAQCRAHPPAVR